MNSTPSPVSCVCFWILDTRSVALYVHKLLLLLLLCASGPLQTRMPACPRRVQVAGAILATAVCGFMFHGGAGRGS
jgi:hypothetical protein